MYVQINDIDRNIYMIASVVLDDKKVTYKMINGTQLQEVFSTASEAESKYEEVISMTGGGIPLDEDGKIPAEYLPSYIDDVIDLLALTDTAPSTCAKGDKYYNTVSKKIFTATGTNTWGTTGKDPESDKIYIDTSADPATSYRWDGLNLVLIGAAGGQTIQYTEMPTAEVAIEGEIVQYIGTTTNNYINGYFYKCVSDGGVTPTYSWGAISVQEVSKSSNVDIYVLTTDFNTVTAATSLNAEDIATLNKVIDLYRAGKDFILIAEKMYFWWNTYNYNYSYNVPASVRSSGNTIYITFYRTYQISASLDYPINFNSSTRNITLNNVGTPSDIVSASLPKQNVPDSSYDLLCVSNSKQYTVSGNYNPAHKKYVDDAVANKITQYSTMPTASSSNEGLIAQYIGTTDSTYTNGYFYKCVSDGAVNPTYSWEAINVQASSGGGDTPIYVWDGRGWDSSSPDTNADVKELFQNILYNIRDKKAFVFKLVKTKNVNSKLDVFYYDINVTYNNWFTNLGLDFIREYFGGYIALASANTGTGLFARDSYEIIGGSIPSISGISFYEDLSLAYTYDGSSIYESCKALPVSNTTSFTPAVDSYNPATAKYAESMLEAIAPAYDNTATYSVGDYVTRQGKLYVCSTAISTAEDWTAAHWTQTTVAGIIGNLNTVLASLTTPNNGGN